MQSFLPILSREERLRSQVMKVLDMQQYWYIIGYIFLIMDGILAIMSGIFIILPIMGNCVKDQKRAHPKEAPNEYAHNPRDLRYGLAER